MIAEAVGGLDRMELFVTRLTCVLLLLTEYCRGNRVHFRIHTSDLVNQHTHTRTVYLKPSKHGWTDKGVPLRLGSFHQDQQRPPGGGGPVKHEYFHSTSHPVSVSALAVLPVPRYPVFALSPRGPPVSTESLGVPATYSPGPARIPVAHQQALLLAEHPRHKTAALKAPDSQADLKKGCRMFIDGHGVEVADGNCFLEEYEKGYNQEESKKTFYGDGHYNEDTQQDGERSSNKYKNEHKYLKHPVIRHDWVQSPDGKYLRVQTKVQPGKLPPGSRGAARQEGPLLVRLTNEMENSNLVGAREGVRLVGPVKGVKLFRVAAAAPGPKPVREEEDRGPGVPDVEVESVLVEDFRRQRQQDRPTRDHRARTPAGSRQECVHC